MPRELAAISILFLCIPACGGPAPRPSATLIGAVAIPANARDRSGLTDSLADGTPHDVLGGLGSAIAYLGSEDRYVLVPDRGPKDGAVDYRCRMHFFRIARPDGAIKNNAPDLERTVFLQSESGTPLTGLAEALETRFDPEGVRVGRNGALFICDEYAPSVIEFDEEGKHVRTIRIPKKFTVAQPHADATKETAQNDSGRISNRGFEGLAITPAGDQLFAALQSPLIQDGGREGRHVRLLQIDLASGKSKEFVYPLESKDLVLSEILALNDQEFLVIERDNAAGADAKFKKIIHIDIAAASDVSETRSLPNILPKEIAPVRKSLFIDLLDSNHRIARDTFPAKIEGLTFGPDLPDGKRLLWVTSDNDFKATEPSWLYAFAIDPAMLPNFKRQAVD